MQACGAMIKPARLSLLRWISDQSCEKSQECAIHDNILPVLDTRVLWLQTPFPLPYRNGLTGETVKTCVEDSGIWLFKHFWCMHCAHGCGHAVREHLQGGGVVYQFLPVTSTDIGFYHLILYLIKCKYDLTVARALGAGRGSLRCRRSSSTGTEGSSPVSKHIKATKHVLCCDRVTRCQSQLRPQGHGCVHGRVQCHQTFVGSEWS